MVAYWQPDGFVLHQFARGTRTVATAPVVALLDAAAAWQTVEDLAAKLPGASAVALRPPAKPMFPTCLTAAAGCR